MSGGVDSSLAALLLAEKGYEVIGFTLRLHDEGDGVNATPGQQPRRCCAVDGAERARQAALKAGGRHYVIDARREFERAVIDNFEREYARGRTPNPCIRCNTHLKWDFLINHARTLGATWFATGHHARVATGSDDLPVLKTAVDAGKDQGYALYGIPRRHLMWTLLPIGELPKSTVRELALAHGLAAAGMPDSQEICFVPDDDYRGFLQRRLIGRQDEKSDLARALTPGQIVDASGAVLGRHNGIASYTVGQRRGLRISAGYPLYVEGLDPETRTVTVGDGSGLQHGELYAEEANWVSIEKPVDPFDAEAAIRYNGPRVAAMVFPEGTDAFRVTFNDPPRAITPGQSVVLFDGEIVLGGGVIAG
jgi:tRNA-specific 2-thiouridylase